MKNKSMNTLITLAKNGDLDAIHELWSRVSTTVENTHEFSKVGTRRSRATRSKYAASFEEMSGELYEVFLKCVKDFDASRGASFTTFLNFKVKMFAEDVIRNSTKKITRKGEKMDVRFVSYEKLQNLLNEGSDSKAEDEENLNVNIDGSSLDLDGTDDSADRYAENASQGQGEGFSEEDAELQEAEKDLPAGRTYLLGSYCDRRRDPTKEKTAEVLKVFKDDIREKEVLETYLKLADINNEKPTVEEVGKVMGVTGSLVSHYMGEIRKRLKKEGIGLR